MSLAILNNETPETCRDCGGKCCQRAPGQYLPADFGLAPGERITQASAHKILGLMLSGRVVANSVGKNNIYIDSKLFGRRPRIMFLRPATRNEEPGLIRYGPDGSPCINWSGARGCSLEFEERPWVCRVLIATPEEGCTYPSELNEACIAEGVHPFSVNEALIQWRPYQRFLKRLVQAVREAECKKEAEAEEASARPLLPAAPPKRIRVTGTPEGERYIPLDN